MHPGATLGLGIAALTCLAVLFVTGLTLFLYYLPDQERAYERILHISTTLRFGGLVRDLHYVAANALVLLSFLHLMRVFFTGGYKGRRLNWFYGLGLLMLVLLGNFTGYLLPWDQVSYWAIKVGAGLADYFPLLGPAIKSFVLGGEEIGPETLLRSFALHAGTLPPLMMILTSLHLWRIRKDGGLALPHECSKDKFPASPWLYLAEGAVAMWTLAALVGLALVVHAPIYERANPLHPPNPAKSPWYFVGFQEMVSYSALLGGVVAPMLFGLFLALCPFLDRSRSHPGIWLPGDRWRINLVFALIMLSQVVFIVIGQWFRGANWSLIWPF